MLCVRGSIGAHLCVLEMEHQDFLRVAVSLYDP